MQKINLYKLEQEPDDIALSYHHIKIISLIFISILGFITLVMIASKFKVQYGYSKLQSKAQTINKEISYAKSKIYSESDKNKLLDEIRKLELKKANIDRLMISLNRLNISEEGGFSDYMKALSKYSLEGLWLTNFQFANGGRNIMLQGTTTDSEYVPKLIQKLGGDKKFKGKKFETFRVYREKKPDPVDEQGATINDAPAEYEIKFVIGSTQ